MKFASDKDDAFLQVVQVATSSCVPMALQAAIKLQVMDILAQHKGSYLSASQIAAHFALAPTTSLHNAAASLDRILRLLASHGLLSCSPLYTNPQARHPTLTYTLNSVSHYLTTTTNNNNDDNVNDCDNNNKSGNTTTNNDNVDDGDNNNQRGTTTSNYNSHHHHCDDNQLDDTKIAHNDDNQSNDPLHAIENQPSLAPYALLDQEPILVQTFCHLHEAILEGVVPFTKLYGMPFFSYTQHNPHLNKLFNLAMVSHTKTFMASLLQFYHGFGRIVSLLDVGGGIGACLSMIISRYPHIHGINFDLPHVIASAPEYPGVKHIGGDMFEALPKAEAIFMKWILHDWSDDHCLKILGRCYEALPSKGKMIIVETLLPSEMECTLDARVTYQRDVRMLAYNEGGRERTKNELEDLTMATGFIGLQVMCKVHDCSIVEVYKS